MSICAMNSLLSHTLLVVLTGMYAFGLGMGSPVKDRVYPQMDPNQHGKVGHDYLDMNTETCGLVNSSGIQTRIVNGAVAEKGEFPWMASIHDLANKRYTYLCGGALFGDRFIVTAAHCIWQIEQRMNANIKVYLGSLKKFEFTVKCDVEWYIKPLVFDIGLIKLSEPVKPAFDGQVYTINSACMPTKDIVNENDEDALFSGFGAVDAYAKIQSDVLRKTRITIMGHQKCMDQIKYDKVPENMCATENEHSICNGDSGSPLVQLDGNRAVVIAIAGGSDPDDKDLGLCSAGFLYFTRVSMFIDWISDTMKFVPPIHVDPAPPPTPTKEVKGVASHSHAIPHQMVLFANLVAFLISIFMQTN